MSAGIMSLYPHALCVDFSDSKVHQNEHWPLVADELSDAWTNRTYTMSINDSPNHGFVFVTMNKDLFLKLGQRTNTFRFHLAKLLEELFQNAHGHNKIQIQLHPKHKPVLIAMQKRDFDSTHSETSFLLTSP